AARSRSRAKTTLYQFLMMSRLWLARALLSDIAAADEQARRDHCRELGEIPALQQLSGCGRAAASHWWDRNSARSPARAHPCCPAFVALTRSRPNYVASPVAHDRLSSPFFQRPRPDMVANPTEPGSATKLNEN